MKPLDRNSQIGRLYKNMKRVRRFISTAEVSKYCGVYAGNGLWFEVSYAPSTKKSQLDERLPADEQIRHKLKIINGKPVHFYRLEKI